jgi:hypothetical protein
MLLELENVFAEIIKQRVGIPVGISFADLVLLGSSPTVVGNSLVERCSKNESELSPDYVD